MPRKQLDDLVDDLHDETRSELSVFLDEATALLGNNDAFIGDKAEAARTRLSELLSKASTSLASGSAAVEGSSQKVAEAKAYVQANPWKAAAIAAGAGLVIATLLRRR